MNELFFSIITPVYNRQDCIARCIESVLNQNYDNIKHIIVDDGSTDSTKTIVNDYKDKYPEIINFISYRENKGKNFAVNRGIDDIKDGYVILLDSDDFLLEDAIKIISEYIKNINGYKYYMFIPDDRLEYANKNNILKNKIIEVNYLNWLRGDIEGDFLHVIHIDVLKKYPFFENLRLYEYLNFLRMYKYTKKQLIIKEVVVGRERNRGDALTNESYLYKKNSINNEYFYLSNLLELFEEDLKLYAKNIYSNYISKIIYLGLALSKYDEIKKYVNNNKHNFLLNIIIKLRLGKFVKLSIIVWSYVKNKFLKKL